MRLDELRAQAIEAIGESPRRGEELWPAFLTVVRAPLDEPAIIDDIVEAAFGPPIPRHREYDMVSFTRLVNVPDSNDGELEASFSINAEFTSVEFGPKVVSIQGGGPAADEASGGSEFEQFVVRVESLPQMAALRRPDPRMRRWWVEYEAPARRE